MNDLDFIMGNQMIIMDALADLCEKAGLADTEMRVRQSILLIHARLSESQRRRDNRASANQK